MAKFDSKPLTKEERVELFKRWRQAWREKQGRSIIREKGAPFQEFEVAQAVEPIAGIPPSPYVYSEGEFVGDPTGWMVKPVKESIVQQNPQGALMNVNIRRSNIAGGMPPLVSIPGAPVSGITSPEEEYPTFDPTSLQQTTPKAQQLADILAQDPSFSTPIEAMEETQLAQPSIGGPDLRRMELAKAYEEILRRALSQRK